jgi:heme exporter protein A
MVDANRITRTRPASNEPLCCADEVVAAANVRVIRNRVSILNDISLQVRAGETAAILGPNGAGKSTLLKCFAGAIRPDHGNLRWFNGSSAYGLNVRRKIGFAGHEHGLYGELTALENVVFAARMYGIASPRRCVASALTAASLAHLANKRVAVLSQGLRQRIAILRSTIHNPSLILLDEPFASLDGQGRAWLDSLFESWRRSGQTVCFVCHDAAHSRALADRVVTLECGRVVDIEETHVRSSVSRWSA